MQIAFAPDQFTAFFSENCLFSARSVFFGHWKVLLHNPSPLIYDADDATSEIIQNLSGRTRKRGGGRGIFASLNFLARAREVSKNYANSLQTVLVKFHSQLRDRSAVTSKRSICNSNPVLKCLLSHKFQLLSNRFHAKSFRWWRKTRTHPNNTSHVRKLLHFVQIPSSQETIFKLASFRPTFQSHSPQENSAVWWKRCSPLPPSKEYTTGSSGKQFFRFTFVWHVAKESERSERVSIMRST